MTYRYDIRRDSLTGHDWPGVLGNGFPRYVLDEIEVGARAAMGLDDPEQWWWEINREWVAGELGAAVAVADDDPDGW